MQTYLAISLYFLKCFCTSSDIFFVNLKAPNQYAISKVNAIIAFQ